jgi:dihydroorotase
MIKIKRVRLLDGSVEDFTIQSERDHVLDAEGKLTLLPALIDPHVHFRVPGAEHKEDWKTAAQAAIAGGVTTVFDMPNNMPSMINKERLEEKKHLIDQQLEEVGIPLRYYLYLGADQNSLDDIGKVAKDIVGIKVYMGSSTGDLLMTDERALDRVFQIAAQQDLVVSVHAEDEKMIQENKIRWGSSRDPAVHSKIRDRKAAIKAVKHAISLAEKYNCRLAILHLSTKDELDLVREAKKNEILVYAEATPHHLFLTEADYKQWGTKVQMNPPLRTLDDQKALWHGIADGTIDMIGSDHAPHTLKEKAAPYGSAPSGVPGIETTLPLLLNAYHEKRISLEKIIALTRFNIMNIFELKHNSDVVLVDLELTKEVTDSKLKTKCGWSPFSGRKLKGWPVYTILKGQVFNVS